MVTDKIVQSFKNCFQLVGNRAWAAETKYDGGMFRLYLKFFTHEHKLTTTEYCEIHVNLEDSPKDIQIFSKNGKDATKDRHALHRYLDHRQCIV
jgi:DNA ligase-4